MPGHILTVESGAVLTTWTDPRLNPHPLHSHRYYTISAGETGNDVRVFARPGPGVAPVADAGLGGDLFLWSWGERGSGAPPAIVTDGGESAKVTITFFDHHFGHWLLTCWRAGSGAVGLPIFVTSPEFVV